jgi:hypothetical protein
VNRLESGAAYVIIDDVDLTERQGNAATGGVMDAAIKAHVYWH